MKLKLAAAAMALFIFGCEAVETPDAQKTGASQSRLEADVRFLSDDLLEGREAGQRGYDLSAHYVAERFRAIGLAPGGDKDGGDETYFQNVPMLEFRADPNGRARLTITGPDGAGSFTPREDYLVFPSPTGETIDFEAPAVFLGFGFASEAHNRDDFEGLDLEGKIAVYLRGAPKYLNSEEGAHFGATTGQRASEHGAVATLFLYTESFEKTLPFERLLGFLSGNRSFMSWLQQDGTPFTISPNIHGGAMLNLAGAEKLFAMTDTPWAEISAAAESEEGAVKGFDLGLTMRIETDARHSNIESPNVVGILPGSDPALRDEYIVLTAHLDHDGVKATDDPDDDEIYNGAMDNTVGIAALIEVAQLLANDPPARSVIFVALTAEEKGLIGSDYYARNPTVPADAIVANVNLDMPILTYDFTDVIAYGAERSTLYPIVERAVADAGLTLSPDPAPEQNLFTRSDQYSFVKQGVPAVYLKTGFANGGEEAQKIFRAEHYHQASDEIAHINFDALRRFTDIKAAIARGAADMPERPRWKAGDFFGTTFYGPMEEAAE